MPAKFQFTSEIWSLLPNPSDVNFRSIVSGFFRRREIDSPLDQVHEQENKMVKGYDGAVGLIENPVAFR